MNQDNIKQQIKPGGGTSVLGGALRAWGRRFWQLKANRSRDLSLYTHNKNWQKKLMIQTKHTGIWQVYK
jgi:hypothetical protein